MKRPYPAAAILMGLLLTTIAHAVTPLTPRLTPESSTELLARLTELGFPQVGHNSVVIAVTQVLGLEPGARTYDYHEPYPHLPQVQARATPGATGCAVVTLHATYQQPRPGGVRLEGTYCVSGLGQWQARQQVVRPDP